MHFVIKDAVDEVQAGVLDLDVLGKDDGTVEEKVMNCVVD